MDTARDRLQHYIKEHSLSQCNSVVQHKTGRTQPTLVKTEQGIGGSPLSDMEMVYAGWIQKKTQYIAAESAQLGNGLFVPLLLFTCFMIQFNLQWRKASPNDFSFLVNESQTNTWMYRVNDVTMKVISNVYFHV